jgi:hypothetical protein
MTAVSCLYRRFGETMRTTSLRLALVSAGVVTLGGVWAAAHEPTSVSAIRTSPESRALYLARATIWQDPGVLSPTDVFEGPSADFPYTVEQATHDEPIGCTFAQAGKGLGGNSPKFLCRTADGQNLRLKYWDLQSQAGNREVFATVAASRLMWALGFEAIPTLPIKVLCDGCPENPMKGAGARRARPYIAILQPRWPAPILSGDNIDQGWSWRELDTAILSLPPGPERACQRMYFDALTLLGVFMQHGDRKPEQQRLYCAAPIDPTAGDLRGSGDDTTLMLFERPHASACPTSAVTIVDVGATFGGAGHESRDTTAKMNLEEWQRRSVFADTADNKCRGNLTISLKARSNGEANPLISEEGRRFLIDRLHRLTPDHVRAIFTAARVDQLGDARHADGSARGVHGIDAWVAAFQDKVRQIDARRCQPLD